MAHYNPNAICYTLYETTNLVALFTSNVFQLTFTESEQFHGVKSAVEIRKDIYMRYICSKMVTYTHKICLLTMCFFADMVYQFQHLNTNTIRSCSIF